MGKEGVQSDWEWSIWVAGVVRVALGRGGAKGGCRTKRRNWLSSGTKSEGIGGRLVQTI